MSADIDFLMENFGEGISSYESGVTLAEAGTYRLLANEFRILREFGAIVIPFVIASNPDGSESEFKGIEVTFWLSLKGTKAPAIAADKLKPMGLTFPESFRSPDKLLPEVFSVIGTVEKRPDDRTKDSDDPTFKNVIGRIKSVVNRTPQSGATGRDLEGFE
jgi:hypothetical protein